MAPRLGRVLDEADAYFDGRSRLYESARELALVLEEAHVPYAVAGALALAAHGRVRLTETVDVLTTREGLAAFKSGWLGRGYVEITPGLEAVRDTARNVKIDFLLTGDYPGDGKPKPVAFPDPSIGESEAGGFRVVGLVPLIELKLASGMTAAHRGQDLVDVIALIRIRGLPQEFAQQLNTYVRAKFAELWQLAQITDDYQSAGSRADRRLSTKGPADDRREPSVSRFGTARTFMASTSSTRRISGERWCGTTGTSGEAS